MPIPKMPAEIDENTIVDIIYQALLVHKDSRFKDVSFDGDNDSSSVILVTEDGGHKEWVISSGSIRLLEPDEYTHEDKEECSRAGDHLKSCDEDGYCNLCGEQ